MPGQAAMAASQHNEGAASAAASSSFGGTPPLPSHGRLAAGSLALDFSRLRTPSASPSPSDPKVHKNECG